VKAASDLHKGTATLEIRQSGGAMAMLRFG
jgi:hypothetical protein